MANFRHLLGTLVQSHTAPSGEQRVRHALESLRGDLAPGTAGRDTAGGILGGLLGEARGPLSAAAQNPLQAGGLGALLGSMLGGGGDSLKGAVSGGALALLAGVAFKAMQQGRAVAAAAPGDAAPSSGTDLPLGVTEPTSEAQRQALDGKARLIVKGMLNIAKADGQVGADELQRILSKAETEGLDATDRDWLAGEIQRPLDLDAFAAEIPNREVAAEVYAASLLAVEVDTAEERDYLQGFAEKTGLHPLVVQHIHRTMGVPAVTTG